MYYREYKIRLIKETVFVILSYPPFAHPLAKGNSCRFVLQKILIFLDFYKVLRQSEKGPPI